MLQHIFRSETREASSGGVYGTAGVVLEGDAGSPYYVDPNLSDIGYHAGYVNGEWETVTGNLIPTDYGWVSAALPWTALAAAINGNVTVSRTSGWSDTYCFRHTEDGLLYDLNGHPISLGTHSYNPATSTYEVQVNLDRYSYVTVNVTGDLVEELKVADHDHPGNDATAIDNNYPTHLVCGYASTDGKVHLDLSVAMSPSLFDDPRARQYVHWGIYQGIATLAEGTFASGSTLTNIAVTPFDDIHDIAVMAWLDSNENTVLDAPTETALSVAVARVKMEASRMSYNGQDGFLDHAKNATPGAYVPLNNDDDAYSDYDGTKCDFNDTDKAGQLKAIPGEDDLLPIVLRQPPSGTYTFHSPGGNLRLWMLPQHIGQIKDGGQLNVWNPTAHDITLYVEGVAQGSDVITVDWSSGTKAIPNADSLTVNVFTWLGPLNVPGYTRYKYTAAGGGGDSAWVSASGGTMESPTNLTANVLWGGGPTVGKAFYQASADYTWGLSVNVVQIQFGAPNTVVARGSGWQKEPGSVVIYANDLRTKQYAMNATITVANVTGPTVNGAQRGRRFMEMGLSQQATIDSQHALYNHPQAGQPKKRARSSLEDGLMHWDLLNTAALPWVRRDENEYLVHLNITRDDQVVKDYVFQTHDLPYALHFSRLK